MLHGGGNEYRDPANPVRRTRCGNYRSYTNTVYHDVEIVEPEEHVPGAPRDKAGWFMQGPLLRRTLETALVIPFGVVAIIDQARSDIHSDNNALVNQLMYDMIPGRIAIHLLR